MAVDGRGEQFVVDRIGEQFVVDRIGEQFVVDAAAITPVNQLRETG